MQRMGESTTPNARQVLSDVIDHKCKYLDIAVISPLNAPFC